MRISDWSSDVCSSDLAARHAERVLTLTSIMSTTGNRRLPRASKEAMRVLANRPMSGDPEDLIAYSVDAARVIGSPGYPAEEHRLQRRVRADFERGFYPQGVARQKIGRAHVGTPVTNAHLVCRLLLDKNDYHEANPHSPIPY